MHCKEKEGGKGEGQTPRTKPAREGMDAPRAAHRQVGTHREGRTAASITCAYCRVTTPLSGLGVKHEAQVNWLPRRKEPAMRSHRRQNICTGTEETGASLASTYDRAVTVHKESKEDEETGKNRRAICRNVMRPSYRRPIVGTLVRYMQPICMIAWCVGHLSSTPSLRRRPPPRHFPSEQLPQNYQTPSMAVACSLMRETSPSAPCSARSSGMVLGGLRNHSGTVATGWSGLSWP